AAYKTEFDPNSVEASIDNGLSAGLTVSLPLKKGSDSRLSLDYAFRATDVYQGTHNFGLRIDL
ncbi:MAG TPA: DUF3308 domain-containing protein, partial [Saprospiraceae bacterium]|nr:DUF3308 domain-containing protein [Saprospiraceae bacterium]